MQRVTIELAVNGCGGDAQFSARPDDTNGDLASIGDQNIVEHVLMITPVETPNAISPTNGFVRSASTARAGGLSFEHVASTGSTNDDLAEQARVGITSPAVLVADHQTTGRGRLDRRWIDQPGQDLLVSFRLGTRGHAHAIVAAVAVSLRAAVEAAVIEPVRFKWPNDLVVQTGRHPGKLAGMLAEYVAGDPPVVIVGCGLNVGSGADQRASGATSMADIGLRVPGDRDAVLSATIEGLLQRIETPKASLVELRSHSATLGRRVRVELPNATTVCGVAVDMDEEGRLVIRGAEGATTVGVGDIVHLVETALDQVPSDALTSPR